MIIDNLAISLQPLIDELTTICGHQYVFTDKDDLYSYERDETLNLCFPFDILAKPSNTEEIAAIVRVCNTYKIPITPRGGGSGVTGGALPVNRGVLLSLERLNKIIEINTIDSYVIAEAGVITADLCNAVEQAEYYFPVPPSSSTYSFVGGNVAENAGSIYSCKYGTTAQYVLNLEVVLPTGEIIWTGANVLKNSTGLNLTQLFVGSEGVLGIITKIVYKLLHKPMHSISLLTAFEHLEDACNAVIAIKQSGVLPCAVELIYANALHITAAYLNESLPLVKENIKAHLLVELQDSAESTLIHSMNEVASILEAYTAEDILTASTALEKEKLWKLRFSIGNALTYDNNRYRDIDTCVPLSLLYDYIIKVEAVCKYYNISVACFGHALDGNLHTMLMIDADIEESNINNALYEIYSYAIAKGGVISGEHGIGLLQKEFMPMQFSKTYLQLMQNIKHLFDPNGILNPGKIF